LKSKSQKSGLKHQTVSIDAINKSIPRQSDVSEDLSKSDSEKEVRYEQRVVAFVDILGFKEIIRASKSNTDLVVAIHNALSINLDAFAQIFAKEIGSKKSADDFDDKFTSFSDCIVMSVKTDEDEIGLLIFVIFKLCRELLQLGFASRGGIAMGELYHKEVAALIGKKSLPAILFGPAFIEAYQFESNHADGPRVILENQVRRKIDQFKFNHPTNKLTTFFETHVKRASDGPAYIDLFADFTENNFYAKGQDLSEQIAKIRDNICKFLDNSTDKPHFFKKNALLAQQFNEALSTDELQEYKIPGDKLPIKN
jgi:hypothetical protein